MNLSVVIGPCSGCGHVALGGVKVICCTKTDKCSGFSETDCSMQAVASVDECGWSVVEKA